MAVGGQERPSGTKAESDQVQTLNLDLRLPNPMRIYFTGDSEPMVTGTESEHSAMVAQVREFLAGSHEALFLPADVHGSPAPYAVLLKGIRLARSDGPVLMSLSPEGEICVAGSATNIDRWAERFVFPPDSDIEHRHIDNRFDWVAPASIGLIIEIDDHDA